MTKKIVNDVTPPGGRRSVRDIPVPPRSYRYSDDSRDEVEIEEENNEPDVVRIPLRGGGRRRARWVLWGIVGVALVGLAVAVSIAVSGATVTVTLKSSPAIVSMVGTATIATTTTEVYLPYTPLVLEGNEKVSLESEGSKKVERKASGTIIVYNNFSTVSQRLIKNTRFETPDGFIYRIQESIVVPGKTTSSGKPLPGSIEAVVYADRAGAEYNIGLSDFTIPGFKTISERYAGFYARSKTVMTGGLVGTAPFVSPEKISAARTALRKALEEKLGSDAAEKVESGSLMLAGGYSFKSVSEPETETADKKVSVSERGTLTAFVFSRDMFASYLARRVLLRYDDEPVSFEKTEDLSFEFLNKADFGKNSDSKVLFDLRGSGTVVWTLDEERLKLDLSGKLKSETVSVLASYPSIERSQIVIRPFWKKACPDNIKKISVVIKQATSEAKSP